jgi:hypothetical protein
MTRKYIILLLFLLLSSCEKNQDKNDIILKFYGDAFEDIGYSVTAVTDGYVIAGQLTDIVRTNGNYIDSSDIKMGIIKVGPDGIIIWKKSFGDRLSATGLKVLPLDDGSLICSGYAVDSVTLEKDVFVVKVNSDATQAWQKIYKSSGDQYGTDIIKTQEGYMILGTTNLERQPLTDSTGNVAGKKDIYILRINNNLEPIVAPTAYGFPGNDIGVAIKHETGSGYIVVGTTDRSDPGQDKNNIFLLRINSDGSATEPKIIGGKDDEYVADIEVLNDGYLVAGIVGSEGTNQLGYVWKISGNIYAAPIFGHEIVIMKSPAEKLYFSIKAISRYKTNSFVMAGQSGTGSSAKMLIFLTGADGNVVEGKQMIAGGTGIQVAYDVISDDNDNVIAVGKNSYGNNSMISLLKFRF